MGFFFYFQLYFNLFLENSIQHILIPYTPTSSPPTPTRMSSSHLPPNFRSFKLFLIQPAIIINHHNLWTQRCLISSGLHVENLRQTEPLKDVRDIENQFYEGTWSGENDLISTSFLSAISLWVFLILRNPVAFSWQAKVLQVEEPNPYTYRQAHIHVRTPSWQLW